MNTLDILIFISEKREEFEARGLDSQDALRRAKHAVTEEYHICSASITKLIAP